MGQVKPWQVVLIVAAVVAMGVSLWYSLSDSGSVKLADELMLVDVTTGDLFAAKVSGGKAVVTPAKNPETGKVALLWTHKNEKGVWTVSARDLSALPRIEGEPKALVDRRSGEVKVTSETPKKFN